MALNDFLSVYGYLVVLGCQAIYVGISGLIHYLKNKSKPETLEKKRIKLINKLRNILNLLGYKEDEVNNDEISL